MNIKKKRYLLAIFSVGLFGLMLFLFLPAGVDAASIETGYSIELGTTSPEDIAINIINWVLGILAIIAVIIIIVAGVLWMTSGGNEERIQKAKKILIAALIGLLIILAAWGIVWYIFNRLSDWTGDGAGGGECSANSDCGESQYCCYPARVCAEDCGGFPGSSNFYVAATWPRNMQEDVFLCSAISVNFSKDINKSTVKPENYYLQIEAGAPNNANCTLNKDCASGLCQTNICIGDHVDGIIKFGPGEQTKYADLILNTDMEMNATYRVTVEGTYEGVRALDGTVLNTDGQGEYTWVFTTGSDTDVIPPVVEETASSPFPGDESVDACLNTPIYTVFSEQMLPSSFNDDVAVNLSDASGFSNILGLKNWDFGGRFDYFSTRPAVQLAEYSDYFVRLFGGTADENYTDAPMDMCGNPLDGDRDGDIDAEGTPVDDFISSDDTTSPNDVPWHFTTGINTECTPDIDNFNPGEGFYCKDNDPPGPGYEDEGSVGWISIYGRYFVPEPIVYFHDNILASRTYDTCFNQNFTVGAPNNFEAYEGTCLLADGVGQIDMKIPTGSRDSGPLKVSVAGDTSDPSEQEFTELSPVIYWTDPSSGGVGQYVTIGGNNFGQDRGTVIFRKIEGAGVTVDAIGGVPDNPDCGDTWTDEEVITVVPQGFNLDDIVQIQVVTTSDKRSNLRKFTITDKVGPGLCQLIEDCNETAGSWVTFVGEKFGDTQAGSQTLFGVTPGADYRDWSDVQLESQANNDLPNGRYFNRVETDQGLSNGRTYSIPCSKTPRVEDNASCEEPYPSPSPRPGGKNACLDSALNIVFEVPTKLVNMDRLTFTNNNIKFFQCNTGGNFDSVACTIEIPLTIGLENYIEQAGDRTVGFRLYPGELTPNTWYKGFVSSNVSTTEGIEMDNNYSWNFRTQEGSEECVIERVTVRALAGYGNTIDDNGNVIVEEGDGSQGFEANPRGPDCQFIDGSKYTWNWNSTNQLIASIIGAAWTEIAFVAGDAPENEGRTDIQATTQNNTGSKRLSTDFGYCESDEDCSTCPGSICDLAINRCTPVVNSICPISGPRGQWVTIAGCMFGAQEGNVYFNDNLAPYPDAEICGQTWSTRQIIAQVPDETNLGSNTVKIINFYGQTAESATAFNVEEGSPGIMLCSVGPSRSREGKPIEVRGINFGDVQGTGIASFLGDPNRIGGTGYTYWDGNKANLSVPAGALTGEAKLCTGGSYGSYGDAGIIVEKDGQVSNPLAFYVDCAAAGDCTFSGCCKDRNCRPAGFCLPPNPGEPCIKDIEPTCQTGSPACYPSDEYSCITGFGYQQNINCLCCCDPNIEPSQTNFWGLQCTKSIEPCTGEDRGLYCGCGGDDILCNPLDAPLSLACGTDDCCHTRPDIESTLPAAGADDICPNAKLTLTFNQVMDHQSLTYGENGNIKLTLLEIGAVFPGTVFAYEHMSGGRSVTSVDFILNDMLFPSQEIEMFVSKDVKSKFGIPMGIDSPKAYGSDYSMSFTTREDVCVVEFTYLDPDEYIFTEPNVVAGLENGGDTEQGFVAGAFSDDAQELVSYPSYGWTWTWYPTINDESIAWITPDELPQDAPDYLMYMMDGDQDGEINLRATATNVGGSNECTADSDCGGGTICSAGYCQCTADSDCYGDATCHAGYCEGPNIPAYSLITVFLCDNPWPVITDGVFQPFEDPDYHFKTMYCLDTGLPNLDLRIQKDWPDDVPPGPPKTFRIHFLTQEQDDSELIGIRVFENLEKLTAAKWYQTNVKNASSFSSTTIGGYDAIQTGNSTYVAASNVSGGTIWSNIYLFSSTSGSDFLEIYSQILQNIKFDTDITNMGDKKKLQRDTKRITDIGDMVNSLEDYYISNGQFPDLTAGVYLPHYTTSIWGLSWNSLGNMLGVNYQDPVNEMSSTLPSQDPNDACVVLAGSLPSAVCLQGGYGFERIEDVPTERLCGENENSQQLCCDSGQECLEDECFDSDLLAAIKTDVKDDDDKQICCDPTSGQFSDGKCVECHYQSGSTTYDDGVACWSTDSKKYYCPTDSHIYLYNVDNGASMAWIYANFEFPYGEGEYVGYNWGGSWGSEYDAINHYDPCEGEESGSDCACFDYQKTIDSSTFTGP